MNIKVVRAFGYRLGFAWADEAGLAAVEGVLLPNWEIAQGQEADHWFELDNHFQVRDGQELLGPFSEPEQLRLRLQQQVQMRLTAEAREYLFVHAGVVVWKGAAVVFPGPSRAGKSSLVLELVRAGAQFWSDEFAVLDRQGLVHAYPRPLFQRLSKTRKQRWTPEQLGWCPGPPVPLGVVLMTRYVAGASWRPRQLSADETVEEIWKEVRYPSARADSRKWLSGVVEGAQRWKGARGEAAQVPPGLGWCL
ncbi:hypothetical protein JST97_11915 [bacterium]|nr:hypothetical protein [bacterium]